MALVVEDGTGLPNAQTYVSEDSLQQFADARGVTLTKAPSVLLTLAMDYLESQSYDGDPLKSTQGLAFPRQDVGVPRNLLRAQQFLALIADKMDLQPVAPTTSERTIKRRRVEGAIDIEYADPVILRTSPEFPLVDSLLAGLVRRAGGFGYALNSRL